MTATMPDLQREVPLGAGAPGSWLPLRLANAVARQLPRLQVSLEPGQLVAAAEQQVGHGRLADGDYREGLDVLCTALEEEARLTPAGRWFARGQLVTSLANRLRVQQLAEQQPAIVRRPVGPALVVVGLPRSGTTLLQNLLALDTENRSLRHWEAAAPTPPEGPSRPGRPDPRITAAERTTWLLDRIAPAARALHPTGPQLPTECVTLFANSLASLELAAINQVPSYTRWCLSTDMTPHYEFYVRQLQVLAWQERRTRWALKSPAHLFWLPTLAAALPDAVLVQLHRDPLEVIASYCSLVAVFAAAGSDDVDPAAIGRLWSWAWAEGLRRAETARPALSGRLADVRYADLVADPVGSVEAIYDFAGLPFRAEFARAIQQHVQQHPQHAKGQHHYSLEQFGLSDAQTAERFEEVGRARWR